MAIELELRGDFQLSKGLVETLRGALGSDAEVAWSPRPDVAFDVFDELLLITGLEIRGEAVVAFRVRDKNRAVEAVDLAVACTDAVLAATDADLRLLFGGDRLLLQRAGGNLTAFLTAREPDKDFWDGRLAMLHHAHEIVRRFAGPTRD
jgi:hypothetical protein